MSTEIDDDSGDDLFSVLGELKAPPPPTPWGDFYERLAAPGTSSFISSGIPSIDRALDGGFTPGMVTYVAAKRSIGKSVLIRQILQHAAGNGIGVAYLSLEGSLDAQRCRMLASFEPPTLLSIVRDHYYKKARPREDELAHYRKATAAMEAWPFKLVNHLTSIEMIGTFLRVNPEVRMLGVDQLQHLQPPKGMKRGIEATEANSAGLRDIASKTGVVVLAASQINRPEGQAREQVYQPNEWSLRGSEALAHDADNIFLLNRMTGGRVLQVVFDKIREGESALPVYLRFQGGYSRISEGKEGELVKEYERELEGEQAKRKSARRGARRETPEEVPPPATEAERERIEREGW